MSAKRPTAYQQARLLARVRLAPGCTTRQLADHAGYDPITVRRLLTTLGGLVERRKRSGMWVWYPASPLLLSHQERLLRALASAHGVGVAL